MKEATPAAERELHLAATGRMQTTRVQTAGGAHAGELVPGATLRPAPFLACCDGREDVRLPDNR
jgi:hypothetical protein